MLPGGGWGWGGGCAGSAFSVLTELSATTLATLLYQKLNIKPIHIFESKMPSLTWAKSDRAINQNHAPLSRTPQSERQNKIPISSCLASAAKVLEFLATVRTRVTFLIIHSHAYLR